MVFSVVELLPVATSVFVFFLFFFFTTVVCESELGGADVIGLANGMDPLLFRFGFADLQSNWQLAAVNLSAGQSSRSRVQFRTYFSVDSVVDDVEWITFPFFISFHFRFRCTLFKKCQCG